MTLIMLNWWMKRWSFLLTFTRSPRLSLVTWMAARGSRGRRWRIRGVSGARRSSRLSPFRIRIMILGGNLRWMSTMIANLGIFLIVLLNLFLRREREHVIAFKRREPIIGNKYMNCNNTFKIKRGGCLGTLFFILYCQTLKQTRVHRDFKRTNTKKAFSDLPTEISPRLICDFMKMPFPENSFDAVYAVEATCHAPDAVGCYKEIYRVLKPGEHLLRMNGV